MSILRFSFITSSPSPAHGGSVHYLAAVLSLYWCIWGRAHEGKEEDSSRDNRPLRIVDKIYRRRERERERVKRWDHAICVSLSSVPYCHFLVPEDFTSLLRSIRRIIEIMTRENCNLPGNSAKGRELFVYSAKSLILAVQYLPFIRSSYWQHEWRTFAS